GIPRNVGAGHAAPDTSVLVFVDADVLVVPRALERVLEIHTTHPDAAIFGMVHWLEPMDLVTVARELERDVLGAHVPEATPHRYDGTIVGPDGRGAEHFAPAAVAAPRPVAPELALSTFAAIPR